VLRNVTITLLAAVIVFGLSGCTERKEQSPPNAGASASKGNYVDGDLVMLPAQASPGQALHVRYKDPVFDKANKIEIAFGDIPGHVIKVIDPNTIKVLVPPLPVGSVEATVRVDGSVLGMVKLSVEHPPSLRLFFTRSGDQLELVRVEPHTGSFYPAPTSGRRLSYDVLDETGELLYTSAVSHPATTEMESFDEDGTIRRVPAPGPESFFIKIPYFKGTLRIRLLEADPGLNLADPDDRERRRLLREFAIP
jgi:hypothetical protein